MSKISTQVIHNLKKDKGSFVSFGLIVLFTAFMLNLALVLAFQVDEAYDAKFDALNAASINLYIPEAQDSEALSAELSAIDGVSMVEARPAVYAEAVVRDFRGTDFDMNTVFYNMDDARSVNLLDVREQAADAQEPAIFLPMYVANFGEFAVGDRIVYQVNGSENAFTVAGVAEEMQYGNYGKGMMGAWLSGSAYRDFRAANEMQTIVEYALVADKSASPEQIRQEAADILAKHGITLLAMNDCASTKDTRTMVCGLLILILIAFACVILLVSVFLSKFRISNAIEDEMVSMGVLKAMGYTGSMIIASLVVPYMLVTAVSAAAGIALSYALLPVLADFLTMQSGFSFAPAFDLAALACAVLIPLVIVLVFSLFTKDQPYRVFFWLAAVLAGVSAVFAVKINGKSETDATKRRFYFHKKYTKYYMLEMFYGARKQVFLTFGPYVLILFYGANAATISLLFAISAVACFFASPIVGRIIDRLGYKVVMVADTLILVIVCFFYGFAHHLFPRDGAFVICCVLCMLLFLLFMSLIDAKTYHLTN